jgi:hypothetical protein
MQPSYEYGFWRIEMAKQLLTNILVAGGLAVAMATVAAGDARAFTETPVTPQAQEAAPNTQAPSVAPQVQSTPDGNGLHLSTPGDAKSGGTEIKVPGVGSVGTIPKLDFGLELLYNGNGNAPAGERPLESKEDVQIKGSITHRF